MSLNAVYVKLLHQNWSQACRPARRLSVSLSRLENYLPVTAAIISAGEDSWRCWMPFVSAMVIDRTASGIKSFAVSFWQKMKSR